MMIQKKIATDTKRKNNVFAIDSHLMDSRFEINGDVSPTVTAKLAKGSADGPLVMIDMKTYALEGNVVDRISSKNGKGWCEDVSPTLNTQDRHAVVFALEGNGSRPSHLGKGFSEDGTMYTLNTIEQHSVCYSVDCRNLCTNKEVSGTLQAKNVGGFSYNYLNPVMMEKRE